MQHRKTKGEDSGMQKERIEGKESLVKVAAVQFNPQLGEREKNISRMVELAGKAFSEKAQLLVFPEMSNSGYVLNTRSEAYDIAEQVPGGPTISAFAKITREANSYAVIGMLEREGDLIYNCAALVGPKGLIGKYRKNHIWDFEKNFNEPGNLGFPVFSLPFGRLAMCICYDAWFPETIRIYNLQGADIVCDPTNWVVVAGVGPNDKPLSPLIHMAQAHMNKLFVVCADRIGVERGVTYLGNSCICGPGGFIKGPASFDKEEILMAEVNLMESRKKVWTPYNHIIRDRRVDLYDTLLGYKGEMRPEL